MLPYMNCVILAIAKAYLQSLINKYVAKDAVVIPIVSCLLSAIPLSSC